MPLNETLIVAAALPIAVARTTVFASSLVPPQLVMLMLVSSVLRPCPVPPSWMGSIELVLFSTNRPVIFPWNPVVVPAWPVMVAVLMPFIVTLLANDGLAPIVSEAVVSFSSAVGGLGVLKVIADVEGVDSNAKRGHDRQRIENLIGLCRREAADTRVHRG